MSGGALSGGALGPASGGDRPQWSELLSLLVSGRTLSEGEAAVALSEILEGGIDPMQIGAFLVALRVRGETVEEMTGLAKAMLDHAALLEGIGDCVDTCGTGGDGSGSINVSTLAALVVAAAGARVCKHGNRAISSMAGSADVLEALGVVIDLDPAGVKRCIASAGIGFCFAPRFHPAMRYVAPVRRELGIATVFNFLGPLSNPAAAQRQLIGVGDPAMAERMLAVLEASGTLHAMVVFGHDGLDELSTVTTSTVLETVRCDGGPEPYRRRSFEVDPRSYGFSRSELGDLQGGEAQLNARLASAVLAGEPGPRRDFVLLNAGAALVVAGIVETIEAGIELAVEVLDSGRAASTLESLVRASRAAG